MEQRSAPGAARRAGFKLPPSARPGSQDERRARALEEQKRVSTSQYQRILPTIPPYEQRFTDLLRDLLYHSNNPCSVLVQLLSVCHFGPAINHLSRDGPYV